MARIVWHSCAPWAASGYGTQTALWTQKLTEMGHEVFISTFWGLTGSPTQWNGIPVLPGFGNAYCSPSLQQHCRHIQPDLVITLGDIWVLDPNVLRELPVAHWLPSDCRPMSLADQNVVDASKSELIAISRFGYDRFYRAGFSPYYVPHAIDMGVFKPVGNRDRLRKDLGLDDRFVIGVNAANNDAIRKAIPEMMLAFARLLQDHPDCVLSLHSGIHQEGGQDLEAVAENLGITDKVMVVDQYRYTAGLVSASALADWYGTLDVLCATTYGEGFGIPIIESQACGVPVITTRASAMEELNPLGLSVDGEPFWNGVHKGWWTRPSSRELYKAFSQAYEAQGTADKVKLREFAMQYEVGTVCEKYMRPVADALLERMKEKGHVRPESVQETAGE
jgi:glycosyltransferase involved in cell wall biosynthesis